MLIGPPESQEERIERPSEVRQPQRLRRKNLKKRELKESHGGVGAPEATCENLKKRELKVKYCGLNYLVSHENLKKRELKACEPEESWHDKSVLRISRREN